MTDTNDMTGEQFASGLKELGWKQVQFAERAGVGAVTVNRWIRGRLAVPAWAAAHLRVLLSSAEKEKRNADALSVTNDIAQYAVRELERADRDLLIGRHGDAAGSIRTAIAILVELLDALGEVTQMAKPDTTKEVTNE